MRAAVRIIVLLLGTALIIQNTCPHGAAGRSLVVVDHDRCDRCEMKQTCSLAGPTLSGPAGDGLLVRGASMKPFPPFLFDDPHTALVLKPGTIDLPRRRTALVPGSILPEEILKPPAA